MRNTESLLMPHPPLNHDIHLCARTARLFSTKETRGFFREWKVNEVNQARWFSSLLFRGWIHAMKKKINPSSIFKKRGREKQLLDIQISNVTLYLITVLGYKRHEMYLLWDVNRVKYIYASKYMQIRMISLEFVFRELRKMFFLCKKFSYKRAREIIFFLT